MALNAPAIRLCVDASSEARQWLAIGPGLSALTRMPCLA